MSILTVSHVSHGFGARQILKDASFRLLKGEHIGLVGANGEGKTTFLDIITGKRMPDEGTVEWCNHITTGYLDQFSVLEKGKTIRDILRSAFAPLYKLEQELLANYDRMGECEGDALEKLMEDVGEIQEILEQSGFYVIDSRIDEYANGLGLGDIGLERDVSELSGGQRAKVLLTKLLLENPMILILDEPTAVLTPQETDRLFAVLRNMREAGHSIIIITHKLHEVLALSDRVSVLRKGQYIGTVQTAEATEESLTEMMVGKKVSLNIDRPEPVNPRKRLEVQGVTCVNKEGVRTLDNATFTAYSGEILGVAGIAGSGQKELLESIAAFQPMESGTITYYPPEGGEKNLEGMAASAISKLGVKLSFVPEDRLGMGLVGSMDMTDNMMLRGYRNGRPFFADRKTPRSLAEHIIEELEVVTPGVTTPVRKLSGGNVQKVLVGREISSNPKVLMVAYPVRGLDINSSYTIYHLLNEQKRQGAAVICVGEDLDVLLELCDRILVLCGGRISGIVDGRTATKEGVGLMMTKVGGDQSE